MEGTVVGLLLLVLLGVSWASHPRPSCRYPPSEWCRSLEIATACKVQKQCMEKFAIRQEESPPKVKVALYYESLCPYSIRFFTEILYPTYVLLNEIMDVDLIPYGNTKETGNASHPFVCQHGSRECELNIVEACVLHHLRDHPYKLLVVYCMQAALDMEKAAEFCFKIYSYYETWDTILDCVRGPQGIALMHMYANETNALDPKHVYVPWITINQEHTLDTDQESWTSLFLNVCKFYQGVKPPICTGIPTVMDRGYSFA